MALHFSLHRPPLRFSHPSQRAMLRLPCLPVRVPPATTKHPLTSIRIKRMLRDGSSIVIRPLSQGETLVNEAASLLTDAFILTDQSRKIELYTRFLRREISIYIMNHLRLFPKTLILGAFESSPSPSPSPLPSYEEQSTTFSSSDNDDDDDQGGGDTGVLIGTVEVSFSSVTRAPSLTNNAPDDKPYLCNMAVLPSSQRKGIGAYLIEAVEMACLTNGMDELYLHLRFRDVKSAGQLYEKTGFVEVGNDPLWVGLLGQERKKLMRKSLNRSNLRSFGT